MESLRIRRARSLLAAAQQDAKKVAATTPPGSVRRVAANARVVQAASRLRRTIALDASWRSLDAK